MDTGFCTELKTLPNALARTLVPTAGIRIGPDGASLRLDEHGDNQWEYTCDQIALRYTVRLHRVDSTFLIKTSVINTGDTDVADIDHLEPLYLLFDHPAIQWRHLFANGGTKDQHYPPPAFHLHEWTSCTEVLRIGSSPRGRSSGTHLPLLLSWESTAPDADGLYCGAEWSGSWYIRFSPEPDNRGSLAVGIDIPNLTLAAGERLDLPAVHLGFVTGGPDNATNALRRYLYERVCPRLDGTPMLPRVSYDHWYGIANEFDEVLLKRQADQAARLGVEVFVVDAAWFPGDFPYGVGNWDRIDTAKLPNGLEAVADYVREMGMQFGLWFEPERASVESSLYKQHPDWFVEDTFCGEVQCCHMNLGIHAAQQYVIELVDSMIRRLGIKWIRWDYNIDPAALWERTAVGPKLQFGHMAGLYRVLDELMTAHPDLQIEQCASGGTRIDLGTIRRAHTIWMSDHSERAPLCRFMQARANRFLPGHLLNSSVPVGCVDGDTEYTAVTVLSRMLGKLAFDGRIADLTERETSCMAQWVAQYKRIRHLFVQDYYQLLTQPSTVEDWDAAQFVSYDKKESAVFVFAGSLGGTRRIALKGLDSEATYELTRAPDGAAVSLHGTELLSDGLELSLGAGEAALVHLRMA
ncbi:MAG: hypothetical protein GF331_22255 [Chitinivibrionales bacterium]|nr:hypothetical protein [Chitinivibrionales bacterium]